MSDVYDLLAEIRRATAEMHDLIDRADRADMRLRQGGEVARTTPEHEQAIEYLALNDLGMCRFCGKGPGMHSVVDCAITELRRIGVCVEVEEAF